MTDEIFLDTSIIIRRDLGAAPIKKRINDKIRRHDSSVTGLVVRQEYKRRVLQEAQYLLNQLHDKGSLEAVQDHVLNVLTPRQERKRKIALNLIRNYFPQGDDTEHTERVRRTLRSFLVTGLRRFDDGVDRVVWESECSCAKFPLTETTPYRRYDFGPTKCSKTGGTCGIADFLRVRQTDVVKILERLQSLPAEKKSLELERIQQFLEQVSSNPAIAPELDPCWTVGDLLIALESAGVRTFYTLNSKESQYLCRALNQDLIIRSNDAGKDDIAHMASDGTWQEY